MDDDLKLLEAELKQLVPSTPPPQLAQRIASELTVRSDAPARGDSRGLARESTDRVVPPWWRLAVLPLAAAAGFAAVLALSSRARVAPDDGAASLVSTASEAPANEQLKPIRVENVLYEKTEEEVTTANGAPARRERLRYVDTITWQNPRTHASLTWSVPREEVRVVPINYQ